MRRFVTLIALSSLLGAGCFGSPSFVPAPATAPVDVSPTMEGGKASTGGNSTTVTPMLETERLVDALPAAPAGWTAADEAVELRNPVPLPDGTRGEYVTITQEFRSAQGAIMASLTDTRGIPALSAYLEGYADHEDETGYRRHFGVNADNGWVTYAYGPNGESDGSGSLVLLIRNRFILQLDGSAGVTAGDLMNLALATNWNALK